MKTHGEDRAEKSDEAALAFGVALRRELDAIGFDATDNRSATLAEKIGLSRVHTTRLLNGTNIPTLNTMIELRKVGLSLDRLFSAIGPPSPEQVAVRVGNDFVFAEIEPCSSIEFSSVIAVEADDGTFDLQAVTPGELRGSVDVPVRALHFAYINSLAIVEDDDAVRALLRDDLAKYFRVRDFPLGRSLLKLGEGLTMIDAFLLDWRLPDMRCEELISSIRAKTNSPIVILTGDTSASADISRALDLKNVIYVAKPANSLILSKTINRIIRVASGT